MDHAPLVLTVLLSYFFWLGAWIAVSRSPLVPDLLEIWVTKTPMLHADVDDWLTNRGNFKLLKVWTCVYCQAFWTSCFHSITCGTALAILWGPAWIFTTPLLILSFYPWYLSSIQKLWKS
jgi:hypothetical protein